MLRADIRNIKSGVKELREFGLVVGGVLLALGGVLFWAKRGAFPYFLVIGAVLALGGAAAPVALKPVQKIWMTAAVLLGWFVTRVILSLFFYLVLTPIAFFGRMFGKGFLDQALDASQASYWNERRSEDAGRERYEKQY